MLNRIFREPLIHFCFVAMAIYAVMNWAAPSQSINDENTIQINDQILNSYLQTRDQIFDQTLQQRRIDRMNTEQRDALIKEYSEQEALFREAKKLGLGQNDGVFRRRLIQKMKYVLEGLASSGAATSTPGSATTSRTQLSEKQIKEYFEKHQKNYLIPAKTSFTHLFFKTRESGQDDSKPRAQAALTQQNTTTNNSQQANKPDYFPYHRNYISKTKSQIARHFGNKFAEKIFALGALENQWQGPIKSAYGHHIIKISGTSSERMSRLSEIYKQVEADAERAQFARAKQEQINLLVKRYVIEDSAK